MTSFPLYSVEQVEGIENLITHPSSFRFYLVLRLKKLLRVAIFAVNTSLPNIKSCLDSIFICKKKEQFSFDWSVRVPGKR